MSSDDTNDKYPGESGRRRFVKGVVGGATLATLGVTGTTAVQTATSPTGEGGGTRQFFGIENVAGPAPRGMPQIPIRIENGTLIGIFPEPTQRQTAEGQTETIAETEIAGYTYSSEWFQYCGLQSLPGIQPDADQSNEFRSSPSSQYEWQSDVPQGEPLTVSMFDNYKQWNNDIGTKPTGKPAMATWRSQDVSGGEEIPVIVLRSQQIEELAQGNSQYSRWISEACPQGFIAWLNKCTHFCCVPGYKVSQQSRNYNAANEVYCPCHQSVYNPDNIVQEQFVALPRPDDAGGGGG